MIFYKAAACPSARSLSLSRLTISKAALSISMNARPIVPTGAKHCRFRRFDVLHQKWRPRSICFLKNCAWAASPSARQKRRGSSAHDVEQAGDVVLGVLHALGTLDAQLRHVVAEVGERLVVEEPGQI